MRFPRFQFCIHQHEEKRQLSLLIRVYKTQQFVESTLITKILFGKNARKKPVLLFFALKIG